MARILLIDDDDAVRNVLYLTLTNCGHTVIEARNGKEGLEQFKGANADLVITDIVMPGTEGFEVMMKLRRKHPAVKIIAISGGGLHNAEHYLHTAKLLGAVKVLAKPFSYEALLAAVNEQLPGGAAAASSPAS
ncbi:MAG TPA: response regulator [Opitutaceae bacterium]|jgi:CheY-like chemotaxis protein|nr:response regulator [Opitutaceae bacterium]